MGGELTKPEAPRVPAALLARVAENVQRPLAKNSRRAYAADWNRFRVWCRAYRLQALPAETMTVCAYLTALSQGYQLRMRDGRVYPFKSLQWASISRALTSIRIEHKEAGFDPPEHQSIKNVLRNIARQLGRKPNAKEPILVEDLRAMVRKLPDSLLGVRNRALLLLGFSIAARREDLVRLDVEDLRFVPQGLVVHIEKGKRDQEGDGADVAVFRGARGLCPVRAVQAWIEQAELTEGALFRVVFPNERIGERIEDQVVSMTVKRAVASIGLDPRRYAGHSLRSGFCTSTTAPLNEIQRVSRHKSPEQVMRYIRRRTLFERGAGDGLLGRSEDEGREANAGSVAEGREAATPSGAEGGEAKATEGQEGGSAAGNEGQRDRDRIEGQREQGQTVEGREVAEHTVEGQREGRTVEEQEVAHRPVEGQRESLPVEEAPVDHEINALAMNDAFYRNPADDKPLRRARRRGTGVET